jgi:hypothetical protein
VASGTPAEIAAGVAEFVEAGDLRLPFEPRRVAGGEVLNQAANPVA